MPCEENLVGQRKGPTVFGEPYFEKAGTNFWYVILVVKRAIAAELGLQYWILSERRSVVCGWCFEGRSSAVDSDGIDGQSNNVRECD